MTNFFLFTPSNESESTNPMIYHFGKCPLNKFSSFSDNEPVGMETDFIMTLLIGCIAGCSSLSSFLMRLSQIPELCMLDGTYI